MGQPVVHWEIQAKDGKKLQDFYTNLFDWKANFEEAMNYSVFESGGDGGIGGGIATVEDTPTFLTFYVQVDDLQAYLNKAEGLGAKTLMPPMEVPGAGISVALFSDLEGNTIGLYKGE